MYIKGQWVRVIAKGEPCPHWLEVGNVYQILEPEDTKGYIKIGFRKNNFQWLVRSQISPLFDVYLKKIEADSDVV